MLMKRVCEAKFLVKILRQVIWSLWRDWWDTVSFGMIDGRNFQDASSPVTLLCFVVILFQVFPHKDFL